MIAQPAAVHLIDDQVLKWLSYNNWFQSSFTIHKVSHRTTFQLLGTFWYVMYDKVIVPV